MNDPTAMLPVNDLPPIDDPDQPTPGVESTTIWATYTPDDAGDFDRGLNAFANQHAATFSFVVAIEFLVGMDRDGNGLYICSKHSAGPGRHDASDSGSGDSTVGKCPSGESCGGDSYDTEPGIPPFEVGAGAVSAKVFVRITPSSSAEAADDHLQKASAELMRYERPPVSMVERPGISSNGTRMVRPVPSRIR